MERPEFVLAAMAPAGTDPYSPVQIQKLLFLLDVNVADATGGPHFKFEPYDYGPFDKAVYAVLRDLQDSGLVEIIPGQGLKPQTYRLTMQGWACGKRYLATLPADVKKYAEDLVAYIRSMSFAELVSAIYRLYPEMRENSVFSGRTA